MPIYDVFAGTCFDRIEPGRSGLGLTLPGDEYRTTGLIRFAASLAVMQGLVVSDHRSIHDLGPRSPAARPLALNRKPYSYRNGCRLSRGQGAMIWRSVTRATV